MYNLTKQSDEITTFQKQPERFLEQIGSQMVTLQKVYRTKLPSDELEMWRETLKDFSVQEFEKSIMDLVHHPPKYQLEDGSIQVWRGMPKLSDVVQVMLDLRDKAIHAARQRSSEKLREEFIQLERRRKEHPEEFFGLADVLKAVAAKGMPLEAKTMPNVRTVWPDIDPDKNRESFVNKRRS